MRSQRAKQCSLTHATEKSRLEEASASQLARESTRRYVLLFSGRGVRALSFVLWRRLHRNTRGKRRSERIPPTMSGAAAGAWRPAPRKRPPPQQPTLTRRHRIRFN